MLEGEGNYALYAVKESKITEDFLGMDMDIKNCQHFEQYEDCTTRKYLSKFENDCHCVPYRLRNFTKENQVLQFDEVDILKHFISIQ